jgi:UDP-3-O-acyl N-acetylglucosamine deacetylase
MPAPSNTGILFRRLDLPGQPTIPALASHRVETNLRTKLVAGNATVEMVEHVMAALYGMQIDNCLVTCDASEMPGLDGSALAIALALREAGVRSQREPAKLVRLLSTVRSGDDQTGVVASESERDELSLMYHLDYGRESTIPSSTSMAILTPDEFLSQIAPARTFLSEQDAQELQRRGFAQHVTYRDLLVFGSHGPIDNSLHFPDECSRHKLLDLIGDLALCGARVYGTISARRSGHNLNGRLAGQLMAMHALEHRRWSRAA